MMASGGVARIVYNSLFQHPARETCRGLLLTPDPNRTAFQAGGTQWCFKPYSVADS